MANENKSNRYGSSFERKPENPIEGTKVVSEEKTQDESAPETNDAKAEPSAKSEPEAKSEAAAEAPKAKTNLEIRAGHLEKEILHRRDKTNLPAFTLAELEAYAKKSCPGISLKFEESIIEVDGKNKAAVTIVLMEFGNTIAIPSDGPYLFTDNRSKTPAPAAQEEKKA